MGKTKVVRKESVDFHINEVTSLETGQPVDYSFKKLKEMSATGNAFCF